jgi:hypothetical protein
VQYRDADDMWKYIASGKRLPGMLLLVAFAFPLNLYIQFNGPRG